jgi:endonuclease YncB( thermonuclease family)
MKHQHYQLRTIVAVVILLILLLATSKMQCQGTLEPERILQPDSQDNSTAAESGMNVLQGEVIKVADGDTLTLRDLDRKTYRVRLEGIDAPEVEQPFGSAAKRALSNKVLRQRVRVLWHERDQFDRILGHVRLNDRYINREMLDDGLAWRFRNYPKDEFVTAEAKARNAKRGLWSDAEQIPPWEFRSQRR